MKASILSIVFLLSLAIAHPSEFSPSHASLLKRCPSFDPAGVKNVGNNKAGQFIGGQCLSNNDCASNCCATCAGAGICSGPGASFQAGKEGCGFGSAGSGAAAASGSTATAPGKAVEAPSAATGAPENSCNAN